MPTGQAPDDGIRRVRVSLLRVLSIACCVALGVASMAGTARAATRKASKATRPTKTTKATKKTISTTVTTTGVTTAPSVTTAAPSTAAVTTAAASAVRDVPVPPPTPFVTLPERAVTSAAWVRCGSYECTNITVPVDHDEPEGQGIQVGVLRRPARVPARRIGVLFLNPGGPGSSAIALVNRAQATVSAEVLDRFDLIGVDPRGVGQSSRVLCDFSVVDPASDKPLAQLGAACASMVGARVLSRLDTISAARDLDIVRAALGEQQISLLGFSYAGHLYEAYTQLFPHRVRAVVLDSPVDASTRGVPYAVETVQGWENALNEFLRECAARPRSTCAFNDGSNLGTRLDQLIARFEPGPPRLGVVNRALLQSTLVDALELRDAALVAQLGLFLDRLTRTPIAAAPASTAPPTTTTLPGSPDTGDSRRVLDADPRQVALFAVLCDDGTLPRNQQEVDGVRAQLATLAPRFVDYGGEYARLSCDGWPSEPRPPLIVRKHAEIGAPTGLVIGVTEDMRTPLIWAQRLVAQQGGRLLTRKGRGHGSTGYDRCVSNAVNRYLVELTLPADGTLC